MHKDPSVNAIRESISPQHEAEIRAKKVKTARDQIILEQLDGAVSGDGIDGVPIPISTKEHESGHYIHYPDGPRHESRVASIILNDYDRVFWANLLVACDGPGSTGNRNLTDGTLVSRHFGTLENATRDLVAFRSYYTPMRLGDPHVIFEHKVGRTAGYFDVTKMLKNPTVKEIENAIDEIRQWVSVNSHDPEFRSIQINFMFAGHGYNDDGKSGIVISDGCLSSQNIATLLLKAIPEWEDRSSPSRLDLFLDCCHSGAIARDVSAEVATQQDSNPSQFENKSRLGFGRFYCACLDDENSFEYPALKHGLFSFAFLNEFSRKTPDNVANENIALRDVGWYSEMRQHPFLVDFLRPNTDSGLSFNLMFPSAKLLNTRRFRKRAAALMNEAVAELVSEHKAKSSSEFIEPLDIFLRTGHRYRSACIAREKEICQDPSSREIFTRGETYEREGIW